MKINSNLSQTILFLAAISAFSINTKAELFVGSSTNVNSLVIASNEVILISAVRISSQNGGYGQINLNGTPLPFHYGQIEHDEEYSGSKFALAGPATLSFPAASGTNSVPVCIGFQRIQGTSIKSTAASANALMQIPAGKTCHFFSPIGAIENYNNLVAIQTSSDTVSNIYIAGGEEFTGPVTLNLANFDPNYNSSWIYSFYLTDDSLALPSGVLQGSTGSFVITVEKSTNLTNWSPVMVQATGADQSAFYKLNFSH
jgi:hypothetical protein